MAIKVNDKNNGVVYTPLELGKYMARKMFSSIKTADKNKVYKVVDPSCGTGELLKATYLVAQELNIQVELYGFDIDGYAINKARREFHSLNITSHFFQKDFLGYAIELEKELSSIFYDGEPIFFDFCIANPPYVRTQLLGEEYSKQLSKQFNLKGKIDIYQAFFAAIPKVLRPGAIISVISSNKFITNKTGKYLRQLLLKNFSIIELIDLGDTKLFDAAVLPAITFARKQVTEARTFDFYSIYENRDNRKSEEKQSIYDIISDDLIGEFVVNGTDYLAKKGIVILSEDINEPWSLSSIEDYHWTKKVEEKFGYHISDFATVKVGIKTTADKVFLNQGFDNFNIEEDLLHPLFSSENASRWKSDTSINEFKKILYPMETGRGSRKAIPVDLSKYKNASKYLHTYFDLLDSRSYIKKSGRKWYEIWVPHDPSLWPHKKIIWPDISHKPKFILDSDGLYVDGNCYWLILNENVSEEVLLLILGICNSKFMNRYHKIRFQNKLYSNKYRFISQYVSNYPMPDPKLKESQAIIDIVKKILSNGTRQDWEDNIEELLLKIADK